LPTTAWSVAFLMIDENRMPKRRIRRPEAAVKR
jgi:hypothetical protein